MTLMIKTPIVYLVLSVLLLVTACKGKTPVNTVDWYKAHTEERKAMLLTCNNNPGELMKTPNCVNALQADGDVTWGARGVPSLGKVPTFSK